MIVLRSVAVVTVVAAVGLLFTFQRPPVQPVQHGFRGTGMDIIYDPHIVAQKVALNQIPASLPQQPPVGPYAYQVYKNVQVVGNIHVGEFTRLMASMTKWVSPQQGCGYCHNVKNMASDEKYTKVVARRMLQMTRHVNADWQSHVQNVGVTCWTCHRGQPVPSNIWFNSGPTSQFQGMAETNMGKNRAAASVGSASLPGDPFTPYLEHDASIRIASTSALPSGDRQSIKQAEWTYALMMHFSQSLGVNCTYCHNSRTFSDWSQSSPQRVNAWYGIRMARDLNNAYLASLNQVFPDYRHGPMGDVAKVNCATCHQGVFKPLYGVSMAKNYPELLTTDSTHPVLASATVPVPATLPPATQAPATQAQGASGTVPAAAAPPAVVVPAPPK